MRACSRPASSGDEAQPQLIGRARLTRVVRDEIAADALSIPIRPPHEPQIDLVVDDGDNPPFELTGVTAVFAELPWIYFESEPRPSPRSTAIRSLPRHDTTSRRRAHRLPSTPSRALWRSEPPMTLGGGGRRTADAGDGQRDCDDGIRLRPRHPARTRRA